MKSILIAWDKLTNGEQLLLWRKRKGMKWSEAAKKVGVSLNRYLRAERDQLEVKEDTQPWHRHSRSVTSLPCVPDGFSAVLTEIECCFIYRRRSKKSQLDIANAIGVSRATVNYMENGETNPGLLVEYWSQKI